MDMDQEYKMFDWLEQWFIKRLACTESMARDHARDLVASIQWDSRFTIGEKQDE